ncbi:unnamed protein product [Effrenium voratum]|uniref:EF-hand domain-containing protein n=1 Tax=Effrenium voratum TaxID=2562239 RepID=A0AA36HNQ5_9DINO|nr:unnamed protein product [Effrenium voratum]
MAMLPELAQPCTLRKVWARPGPDRGEGSKPPALAPSLGLAAASAAAAAALESRRGVRRAAEKAEKETKSEKRSEKKSDKKSLPRARRYTSVALCLRRGRPWDLRFQRWTLLLSTPFALRDWIANLRGLWTSNLLRRIQAPVMCTTAVACAVCCLHAFLPRGKFWHGSTTGHALLVSALGLLLVFRTNTAYSRFWEGRQIWQRILDVGRDISRAAILWRNEMGPQTAAHMCRLVQAFPYCMIEHLRGRKDKSMRAKLERLIGPKGELACTIQSDFSLPVSSNRPLFLVNQLAHTIRSVPNGETVQAMYTNRERSWLMQNLEKLSSTIGACERLVQTPVPLSYVRHTSRFLSLFMLTLPFALVDVLGPYTVPVTCFASWALFGIFEIGLVIEDPFQGVLKVEVIADTLQADIEETIRSLGADDLLDAGALGMPKKRSEKKRSDASSWASSQTLPSTGEEISVAVAGARRESDSEEEERTPVPEPLEDPALDKLQKLRDSKSHLLLQIFQSYDVNGDKAIDKSEMEKVLRDTTDMEFSVDWLDTIFEEADADKDGYLTQAEWCSWAESCFERAEIADLVLRMPSSPLLPADTQDDTWDDKNEDEDAEHEEEEEKGEEDTEDAEARDEATESGDEAGDEADNADTERAEDTPSAARDTAKKRSDLVNFLLEGDDNPRCKVGA